MGTEGRRTNPGLADILLSEGYRFNFFQAVRMLEWVYADRHPVGHDSLPSQEVVRFRTHASLSFPPSSIYEIEPDICDDEPVQMTVAFMGLVGSQGVLPRHYTELILDRLRERDRTLLDFLDLFAHRLTSFFYRAWEKYHVPTTFEKYVREGRGADPVSQGLLSILGLGTKGLAKQFEGSTTTLLGYVGLLSQRPRSEIALRHVLEDYFGLPVQVKQFQGEWLTLAEEDWSRLSGKKKNNILGVNTFGGTHIWDQQARIQLRMGPLSLENFSRLLPSGNMYRTLIHLTQFIVGKEIGFDIRVVLQAEEVPACELHEAQPCPPRLGWSTWLKSVPFTSDADDVWFSGDWKGTFKEKGLGAVA